VIGVFVNLSRVLVFSFARLLKIRVLTDSVYVLAASVIVVFALAAM
jgi:hypothetical protein